MNYWLELIEAEEAYKRLMGDLKKEITSEGEGWTEYTAKGIEMLRLFEFKIEYDRGRRGYTTRQNHTAPARGIRMTASSKHFIKMRDDRDAFPWTMPPQSTSPEKSFNFTTGIYGSTPPGKHMVKYSD